MAMIIRWVNLADGIYWATLVKSITLPMGNKRQYFARAQESARKDVERAFGVLQSRFAMFEDRLAFGTQRHFD